MFVATTRVRKKDGSCRYVALESRVVGLYSGRHPFAEHLDVRQFFLFFAQADPALSKTRGFHHFKHSRANLSFRIEMIGRREDLALFLVYLFTVTDTLE